MAGGSLHQAGEILEVTGRSLHVAEDSLHDTGESLHGTEEGPHRAGESREEPRLLTRQSGVPLEHLHEGEVGTISSEEAPLLCESDGKVG